MINPNPIKKYFSNSQIEQAKFWLHEQYNKNQEILAPVNEEVKNTINLYYIDKMVAGTTKPERFYDYDNKDYFKKSTKDSIPFIDMFINNKFINKDDRFDILSYMDEKNIIIKYSNYKKHKLATNPIKNTKKRDMSDSDDDDDVSFSDVSTEEEKEKEDDNEKYTTPKRNENTLLNNNNNNNNNINRKPALKRMDTPSKKLKLTFSPSNTFSSNSSITKKKINNNNNNNNKPNTSDSNNIYLEPDEELIPTSH